MKLQQGEWYIALEDFLMDDNRLAFIKGGEYFCFADGSLLSDVFQDHDMIGEEHIFILKRDYPPAIDPNENTPKLSDFDKVIDDTLDSIRNLLIIKGKEYRRNDNPFHNFEEGSNVTGQIPERVLKGFLLKHEVSINDMLIDLENGIMPTTEKIHEKFNDNIIYLLLQKAMFLNRTI